MRCTSAKTIVLALLLHHYSVNGHGSPCAHMEEDGNPSEACMKAVREALVDKDKFYFGTSYAERCPLGPISPRCTPQVVSPYSIGSKMFTDLDVDLITGLVGMKFKTPVGEFSACGDKLVRTQSRNLTIDPLSPTPVGPWDVKDGPVEVMIPHDGKSQYFLMIVDVGSNINHGVYSNIKNGDFATADVVKAYASLKSGIFLIKPYAAFLFRQKDVNINATALTKSWLTVGELTSIRSQYNLEGPVAVNWIPCLTDLYGVGIQIQYGFGNNCAAFVRKALPEAMGPEFKPVMETADLTLNMDVHYTATTKQYTLCDRVRLSEAMNFTLYPTVKHKSTAALTAEEPSVTLSPVLVFNSPAVAPGALYTLLMYDPDIPFPQAGNLTHPLIHWLIQNIEGVKVSDGEVVLPYRGPMPPDEPPHRYIFLLLQQTQVHGFAAYAPYLGDCSGGLAGRCQFDYRKFISDNSMVLRAASWFQAQNDDYVQYNRWEREGRNNSCTYCPWLDTCSTGSAGFLHPGLLSMFIGALLMLLFGNYY